MKYTIAVLTTAILISGSVVGAEKIKLPDAYKAAIERTEFGKIQESQLNQADAKVEKTGAIVWPSISLKGAYSLQDASDAGDSAGSSSPSDAATLAVSVTQPLYQGSADVAGIEQVKLQRESKLLQLKYAKTSLYSSVAHSFYDVLSADREKANVELLIEKNKEIVKELEKRKGIGKSRNSEVLMAQSQLAVVQADFVAVLKKVTESRENFALLTGLGRDTEIDTAEMQELAGLKEIQDYLGKALARSDVLALEKDLEAAKREVAVQASTGLPSASLTGNFYPYRTGSNKGSYWDAGLNLSYRLFDGGDTGARVKEAENKLKEAELNLSKKKRESESSIRSAYESLKSMLEQLKALETALKMTESNYGEQKKDYEFSLVTNLDVLQALNSFQSTKRTYDRTKMDAMAAYADLLAVSGLID